MSVKLNQAAYEHAQQLIKEGHVVRDQRADWSKDQPTAEQENSFIERHGYVEFGRWHLGVDPEKPEDTKERYEFPYGDLQDVHRCAILAAESRAGEYGHTDIELAVAHLHGMVDAGS